MGSSVRREGKEFFPPFGIYRPVNRANACPAQQIGHGDKGEALLPQRVNGPQSGLHAGHIYVVQQDNAPVFGMGEEAVVHKFGVPVFPVCRVHAPADNGGVYAAGDGLVDNAPRRADKAPEVSARRLKNQALHSGSLRGDLFLREALEVGVAAGVVRQLVPLLPHAGEEGLVTVFDAAGSAGPVFPRHEEGGRRAPVSQPVQQHPGIWRGAVVKGERDELRASQNNHRPFSW